MINIAKFSNNFRSWQNFRNNSDPYWKGQWKHAINEQLKRLPRGNGINAEAGIQFDWENSTPETLRFNFSYQHMNDHSWTEHELIIQSSLIRGLNLQVTGENKNGIIEYLEEMFYNIFYYEPDYHKQKNLIVRLYQYLKKKLEWITLTRPSFKKQPAKS